MTLVSTECEKMPLECRRPRAAMPSFCLIMARLDEIKTPHDDIILITAKRWIKNIRKTFSIHFLRGEASCHIGFTAIKGDKTNEEKSKTNNNNSKRRKNNNIEARREGLASARKKTLKQFGYFYWISLCLNGIDTKTRYSIEKFLSLLLSWWREDDARRDFAVVTIFDCLAEKQNSESN